VKYECVFGAQQTYGVAMKEKHPEQGYESQSETLEIRNRSPEEEEGCEAEEAAAFAAAFGARLARLGLSGRSAGGGGVASGAASTGAKPGGLSSESKIPK